MTDLTLDNAIAKCRGCKKIKTGHTTHVNRQCYCHTHSQPGTTSTSPASNQQLWKNRPFWKSLPSAHQLSISFHVTHHCLEHWHRPIQSCPKDRQKHRSQTQEFVKDLGEHIAIIPRGTTYRRKTSTSTHRSLASLDTAQILALLLPLPYLKRAPSLRLKQNFQRTSTSGEKFRISQPFCVTAIPFAYRDKLLTEQVHRTNGMVFSNT